jgi:FtsP/CotA-like multicopper oxidase with cupredoxin domain
MTEAPAGPVLVTDSFAEAVSSASAWLAVGDACLTAGTTATPSTSIPACGSAATQDSDGSGALQLTPPSSNQGGMVVYRTPISTADGVQVIFTDDSFGGTSPSSDGVVAFLSDASQAMPTALGGLGGSMGYANETSGSTIAGVANAYLGVGLDEYGNFSDPTQGRTGGPGAVADTLAIRGAASSSYQYIGGYTSGGQAASLPFSLASPSVTSRPKTAPTIREQLTPAGLLTVAIDIHDGNGFVTYYSGSIVGVSSQPAVPANVYLGFTASTGGDDSRHQITNLSVTTLGATLGGDAFSESSTPAGSWRAASSACLTAGTSATPSTSVPACGSAASVDATGQGALQLTPPTANAVGMVVDETPLSTAGGVAVTFTDDSFNGSSPGADGMALFFTDASAAMPTAAGGIGGSLGYANVGASGIANAYVGIGFDEYGNFSDPGVGGPGGPGRTSESIAVRGAASSGYQYIGGYTNSSGAAASLPFSFDQPTQTTRPANAPTISVVLTPGGQLTASIDRHDGNGYVQYYSQSIVGVNKQPAGPANVYVGFSAANGGDYNRHQISGVAVSGVASSLQASPFTPKTSIPNLQAWYDASAAANLTQSSGKVSAWTDLSGNGNTLAQSTASLQPAYTATGINGLGSLTFSGGPYLLSSNAKFSSDLFNESTVFVVSNQSNSSQSSSIAWSGPYLSDPRWNLRLSEAGVSNFDFNNKSAGRLSVSDVPNGPAIWTAAGSESKDAQYLRKDGNTLSSSTGPGATVSGSYPLAVGATVNGGSAGYQYTGQIGEMLVYNRLLSLTETQSVEGYLACKWGLQNRLPANHPYRSSCPQGGSYASLPYPAPASGALVDPTQLRSNNGQLVFNVVASQNSAGSPQLTYNGSAVAPTLRLLPGDTLVVNLTNNLPTPPSGATYLNDTNLHYHGLQVSPNSPGDDSIDLLAMPGQSLHYQVHIPIDHPTGLYWYHSHAHGEAERQNLSGMSGALIIDGIAQSAPQVANMPERVLIVRDVLPAGQALPAADGMQVAAMYWAMQHAAHKPTQRGRSMPGMSMPGMAMPHMSMNVPVRGRTTASTRNPYVIVDPRFRTSVKPAYTASTHCTTSETAVKNWTLNGQTVPTIGIRPGEQQFWRLVNAASDSYLDVAVDNTSMQILALDGVPLASVGNAPLTVSHYVVPPASRIEFVVTGPSSSSTSYLRTNCFDAGSAGPAMPAAVLAQINPAASLTDALKHRDRTPVRPLARVRAKHTVSSIRRFVAAAGIARTQTLTYSDQNTINGETYDPGGPAQFYAQVGTMEQWQIVNNSNQVHTFHIHQVHFLVDQIVGGTAIEQSNVGQVLDNINVPASTANGPGTVTLTMDFTDPLIVGTFLLHCHILSHEDAGMMSKITIGTAPPMTNSAPNGVTFASATAPSQKVTLSGGTAPYSPSGCGGVANASISAATVTITPVAAGSCVITVADSSGLTTNILVTVNGAAAVITLSPSSLAFAGPTAAAQSSTISGGTAPYSASGCSGIATASVSGSSVSVKPAAVGSCTLTIADSASHSQGLSVTVNAATSGSAVDNVTFHQNAARQGWYQAETHLTTANVSGGSFSKLLTLSAPSGMPAFGKVYAQPLYASAESIGGVSHNLVLIATATDQVYAFDDATDNVVWERNFTNASSGITQQSWSDTGCGDVNPDVGIVGTPVIDRSLDRMYVVVPTKESGVFHMRLHAISLQTGADAVTPVEVSASTMLATGGTATTNPEYNFARSALLEANGNVYVGLGSHCDYNTSSTHGWLLAYNASSLAAAGSAVNVTNGDAGNTYFLGAIWMSGYGPAADASGNVYFATGNGPWNGTSDFGMSVLKLPGTLAIANGTYFTPSNEATESNSDTDLGSGGVMLLPDGVSSSLPHLLVQGGKDGVKWLLNRDKLGGQQTNNAGAVYSLTSGGEFGGPTFFQDTNGISYVVMGTGNPLTTYQFVPGTESLSAVANASVGCLECRNSGSQPIVSSNGTNAGTAIVWALKTPGSSGGTITLYAFDALKMTTLYTGAAGTWTIGSGASYIAGALVSPLVANGRVYVPTDGSVAVFGL